jgi:DNA-binding NarL/FixJ family response regulator
LTTSSCQTDLIAPKTVSDADSEKFQRLNDVRAAALEHARAARQLSAQRRSLIAELIEAGYTQSDIAREMGVTRQAVQKMLAVG